MKYIIETESQQLYKKEVSLILNKHNISNEDIYVFDYLENEQAKALMNFLTPNFLGKIKLIILKNVEFLNDAKIKNKLILDLLQLKSENILVLKINKLKGLKNKKILESNSFTIIQKPLPTKKQLDDYVTKHLKFKNTSDDWWTKKTLLDRTLHNIDILKNELLKFELSDYPLTRVNIEKIVFDYKGENIYKLIEVILKGDLKQIEQTFFSLREKGINKIMILGFLINELLLIQSLKSHYSNKHFANYSSKPSVLAKEIKVNDYKLKKMMEYVGEYRNKDFLWIINSLMEFETILKTQTIAYEDKIFYYKLVEISIK